MSKVFHDLYDIWTRLLVLSDLDRKNKESYQLRNVFRATCYNKRFKKSLKIPKVDQNPQIEEQTTQWSKE